MNMHSFFNLAVSLKIAKIECAKNFSVPTSPSNNTLTKSSASQNTKISTSC